MVDQLPDTPDIHSRIAELRQEVERVQKRLMSLCTELALMEDEAKSIYRNLKVARRSCDEL